MTSAEGRRLSALLRRATGGEDETTSDQSGDPVSPPTVRHPSIVRSALQADYDGILGLCRALHRENGQHPLNFTKVRALIDRCLVQDHGCIGVIGPLGRPVAAIVLVLDTIWYSDDAQLLEVFAYVDPAHRSSRHALALIEHAKGLSESMGIEATLGIFSEVRQAAKIRLYRSAIHQAGAFFCHRPASTKAETATARASD